jgi:hypothetical protein
MFQSRILHRTPHIPHIHTCWFFRFHFQIQHTCYTHVFFMCTQVTHIFFMQFYITCTHFLFSVIFRAKTPDFHGISILPGHILPRFRQKTCLLTISSNKATKMKFWLEDFKNLGQKMPKPCVWHTTFCCNKVNFPWFCSKIHNFCTHIF